MANEWLELLPPRPRSPGLNSVLHRGESPARTRPRPCPLVVLVENMDLQDELRQVAREQRAKTSFQTYEAWSRREHLVRNVQGVSPNRRRTTGGRSSRGDIYGPRTASEVARLWNEYASNVAAFDKELEHIEEAKGKEIDMMSRSALVNDGEPGMGMGNGVTMSRRTSSSGRIDRIFLGGKVDMDGIGHVGDRVHLRGGSIQSGERETFVRKFRGASSSSWRLENAPSAVLRKRNATQWKDVLDAIGGRVCDEYETGSLRLADLDIRPPALVVWKYATSSNKTSSKTESNVLGRVITVRPDDDNVEVIVSKADDSKKDEDVEERNGFVVKDEGGDNIAVDVELGNILGTEYVDRVTLPRVSVRAASDKNDNDRTTALAHGQRVHVMYPATRRRRFVGELLDTGATVERNLREAGNAVASTTLMLSKMRRRLKLSERTHVVRKQIASPSTRNAQQPFWEIPITSTYPILSFKHVADSAIEHVVYVRLRKIVDQTGGVLRKPFALIEVDRFVAKTSIGVPISSITGHGAERGYMWKREIATFRLGACRDKSKRQLTLTFFDSETSSTKGDLAPISLVLDWGDFERSNSPETEIEVSRKFKNSRGDLFEVYFCVWEVSLLV